ncbi:glycoside hydrolase family 3 C-terminal domain-containing protein, partial [Flavonifractor hominis]
MKAHKRLLASALALAMSTSLLMPTALASGQIGGEPFSPFEEQIDETLATLSLRHRASLMQGGIEGEVGQDGWYHHQTKAIPHMGIPFLNMANGPMGVNNTPATSQVGGTHTSFGSGLILAATWNEELVEEAGRVMGEEARAKDVALFEAPAFNINRDLTGGRTFEYYSEDPYLTARTAVPYVKGVQSQKVAANIKHYMGNNQEDNRNNYSANMSERAMHEIYLPAFQAAVEEADAWSLMTAANRANGTYTSDNRYLLTNLLRYEWGFDGVALTDWCGTRTNTIAAKAGLDLSMPGRATGVYHWSNLLKEVENGNLSEDVISQAAENMLRLLYRTGVMGEESLPEGSINTPEHAAVERQVAEEGIVLLKNEPAKDAQENILPLNKEEIKSIAVLGPMHSADFYRPGPGGSGATNPPYEVTYLQGIQKAVEGTDIQLNVPEYTYNPENPYAPTEEEKAEIQKSIDAAVAAAKESEVAVIVAGLKNGMPNTSYPEPDTESGDRDDLDFPPEQLQLIQAVAEANPNTVVIVTGSVVELTDFVDLVPGIFQAFYPGQEQGNAMADLLFGVKNPSGRLPHSIPERFEDTVGYVNRDLKNQNINYDEGVYVGYRWHNLDDKADALFPFGHGLSYTTFEYSNAKVSSPTMDPEGTVTVSVDVTNTGTVAGKEVVQLYINDEESTIDRPVRELKGFEKIELQPDETKTVSFTLDKSDLSYWDDEVHSWMAEAGTFNAQFCRSSSEVITQVAFELTEDTQPDERYQVVQAERAMTDSTGTATGSEGENWTGDGYVTFQDKGSNGTFTVNADKAGTYSLIFKYSQPNAGNAQSTVEVNGEKIGVIYGQPTCYVQNGAQVKDIWNYDSVDVTLQEGENTVKLTADVMGFDLDSIIVQDVDYVVETPEPAPDTPDPEPPKPDLDSFDGFAIEAEDPSVVITDGVIAKNHNGYKGSGFYDPDKDKFGTIEWTAQIPETDEYTVSFRYTSLGGRPCDLYIDGVKAQSYKFYTDGELQNAAWETWLTEGYQFQLTEGEHTFKLVNTTKNGPNIDRLIISRDGTVYEAEEGTMGGGTTVQSNREGFTGTGFADYGGAGSYVEIDLSIETFSPYDIEVRYATPDAARPCIVYVDGVEVGRLEINPTGTGNDGWTTWDNETLRNITLSTDNKKLKIVSIGAGPNIDRVVIRGGMETGDNVAPTVLTSTPDNGAENVPVNQTITLGFSEDVQPSTAYESITLTEASGTPVELTKEVDKRTLTIDPTADLKSGTTYTLTVPAKAIKDAAGNDLAQPYTLSFTTEGQAPVETYAVTYALTNLTAEGAPAQVEEGQPLNVTLAAEEGYTLPATVTVTMAGETLTAGEGYTYDSETGALSIAAVTGDVVITAAGEAEVLPPVVTKVTVSPATASVQAGTTQQFNAVVEGENEPD